jgi:hypothetical protein
LIFLAHHFPSPTETSSAARTQTRHDINTFLSHVTISLASDHPERQ